MENVDINAGLFVPDASEDSVDIYDGLDFSGSSNAEKSSPKAHQIKDSMDLYEEIVTEEQQGRESSYSELKSRFQAAQNQIKELRRRVEQMEIKNTGLNTENCRLKKNLCALLQTARQEVTRKDAEIQRLNQQSERNHHHHQSHNNNNNLRDQKSSRSSASRPPPRPPSRHSSPPHRSASSHLLPPPPPSSTPLPPASRHSSPPHRSASTPLPPASRHQLPPPPPSSTPLPPASRHQLPPPPSSTRLLPPPPPLPSVVQPPPPPPPPSDPPPSLPPLPASPPRENHPETKPHQTSRKESDQSSESNRKSSSSSSTRYSESDKRKSKHRDEKYKKSESSEGRHRSGSDINKDCPAHEKNRPHKADKDTGRRYESRSCKSRHRSDRSKSPPPESAASSNDKKGSSRERRQDTAKMSTSDIEEAYRGHRKIKISDGYVRSSDSKEQKRSSSNERCSELFKERDGDRLSKDFQRKEERRREDKGCSKHKRSTMSEMSSEAKSKESDQGTVVSSKERQEKTHEAFKRPSKKTNVTEESSVVESSPNRKLCFMETLNLTLSPVKKPVFVSGSQDGLLAVDEVVENEPDDESSQPDIEDMCVIDEVDSSQLEAGLEDVSEPSPNPPKTLEKTHDVKDVQEKDKKEVEEEERSETLTADKQLKEDSVQSTSAHPDTAERPTTVQLTTSQQMTSLNLTDTSRNREDKLASGSHVHDVDVSTSIRKQHTSSASHTAKPGKEMDRSVAVSHTVTTPVVLDPRVELKCETPHPAASHVELVKKDRAASLSRENPVAEDLPGKAVRSSQKILPAILPQKCQQESHPPASIHKKGACYLHKGPKDTHAVSSTISLESVPQEGLSLPEAIYVLTRTNEDSSEDSGSITTEPSSSTGCIAVSKVSSTTEETALPKKYSELTVTPKKNFSPSKSSETVEPSSSMLLLHDEDSMMHTLSNLTRIPDAISPLRSPIKITKRSHPHVHSKPGHVKSLQKDFSSTAVDVNTKKLDVNKENKYPGSPANLDTQNMVDRGAELPSSHSDTELEEGEILSESDETASGSPAPAAKRAKLTRPVRNKPSPKSLLQKKSEASKETGPSTRSPKSRFKTVCPAATKASFSTVEEVMEIFKMVRAEIRKKYMKLHKTFPKKSFYGVMDNFQESFLEFVDRAHFGQICSQAGELKSKLKKLIASVFSKVSNNGIVKRIFEQQAVDLKQRLWDFVDVQVEYLFKDISMLLKSLCKPARVQSENNRPCGSEKESRQPPAKTQTQCQSVKDSTPTSAIGVRSSAVVPYKTGLGSRGKDIRITQEKDPHSQNGVVILPPNHFPSTPEKSNTSSFVISQNGSLLDKTDFELLTEQQASSLTFNLVRDTQMGEIFKCLLQGSDLMETSGVCGDNTAWSLGTPRKDGDRLLSITTPTKFDSPSKLLTPTKFETPSKLIATWSSISPRKMASKDHIQLNPALFDESCLLEVPSESRASLQSSLAVQRSYSILAEDLAVSLTIPSPLKSDSHLSFLQPSSMHLMSTPDSVISAHISEDALLDGEDASEQDIHLALDTDNSSCCSSSGSSEVLATPFVFKPDLPMQALVMEKSNDHFIVKIRQAAAGVDTTLCDDDSFSRTLVEEDAEAEGKSQTSTPSSVPSSNSSVTTADIHPSQDESVTLTKDLSTQQNTSKDSFCESSDKKQSLKNQPKTSPSKTLHNRSSDKATSRDEITASADESASQTRHKDDTTQQSPSKALPSECSQQINCSETVADRSPPHPAESRETDPTTQAPGSHVSGSGRDETVASESASSPEKEPKESDRGRKRRRHQGKSKAKRSRKEEEESAEEGLSSCKKDEVESKSSPNSVSPNSLHAKNVIRKKGEVVMAWTRDEDRAILLDLKSNGASRETFSALSERLNKPSGQIAHRFYQLMKLFKKQEKMDP